MEVYVPNQLVHILKKTTIYEDSSFNTSHHLFINWQSILYSILYIFYILFSTFFEHAFSI